MTTTVTADQFLANLTRRGVKWRFYKDKADFLTHNRNRAGANASVTPGGFGPVKGVGIHNTAMTASEAAQLRYLYTGDGPNSGKPGPLCCGGITKTGVLVLMGWGAATHMGPSDPKTMRLLEANALSLTGERTPVTMGTDRGTVPVNPFVIGYENLGTKLNAAQVTASILIAAATLEVLGPTSEYGGGSVVFHREATYNRSDPVGVPKDGSMRRAIDNLRRSWDRAAAQPTKPTVPTPTPATPSAPAPVVQKPTTCICSIEPARITAYDPVQVSSAVTPAVEGTHIFEWSYPGENRWREFSRQLTADGKATVKSTPGSEVVYRVRFAPKDTKAWAIDWSPNVAVDVVTLADYDAATASIEALRARVTELEAKA